MKRRISLYIADHLVDLDDKSFVLFNYTMEDMENPAIVRNSFSQSITLKGTPNNNRVFGEIWRSDRQTAGGGMSGAKFDPTQKTPFVIFNEMNEILESGYCKLDGISRNKGNVEYKVSLFGGLGAFFYALSYDEDGNKRTLADLKFTGEDASATELDFPVNRSSVMSAWNRMNGSLTEDTMWDIINFAPAYNGLPSGLFDADKAMVKADVAGLTIASGYTTKDGFVLASLPKEYTEWETKDLRSYLQRPVIKMSKVIEAICQSYNNGGYSVELDEDFFASSNPYFSNTFLTLPIINTLNVAGGSSDGVLSLGATINLPDGIGGNPSTNYSVNLRFRPHLTLGQSASDNLYMHSVLTLSEGEEIQAIYRTNYIVYTGIAYDANRRVIQRKTVSVGTSESLVGTLDCLGYFRPNGSWVGDEVEMTFEAAGISFIKLSQSINSSWGSNEGWTPEETPEALPNVVWEDADGYKSIPVTEYGKKEGECTYSYTASVSARTGAIIGKKDLLSSDKTPADYLLSFCKMFGLVFLYDKGLKKVSIMQKKNFYQDNVIDLTDRVNIGEGIQISPYVFDSKWYDFGVKYESGQFASYYKNLYDRDFGLQRVNTGYGFNAESKDVMESVIFNGACEVLEASKHYCDIVNGNKLIPAVFQDTGGTFTLYKNGEGEEFDLPSVPSQAVKTWLNGAYESCDVFPKVQFHDTDNEPYEERDTLLFFRGIRELTGISDRYALTDDTTIMMELNDNTPCWLLDYQSVDSNCKVSFLPMFSRYMWGVGHSINQSLDFGHPAELDIPDVIFRINSSIYSQYWTNYIKDRYDNDSKVMTCKVNLSGMQVGESLFKSFYFFDGALWALNRIINHSLTTFDDTECEFVKVQDKSNYLN